MTLHICNTNVEWELLQKGIPSLIQSLEINPIFLQLQFLPFLYAHAEDGVAVTAMPDDAFWQSLASLRRDAPRLHLLSEKKLPYKRVEAWGASRAVSAWAEERGLASPIPPWEIVREVNSKLFSFSESPKLEGARLIYNEEELRAWSEALPGPKLLKSCFGVAGQGHFFLTPGYEEKKLRAFLEREWGHGLPLIGEPWVERVLDFSTQWLIEKDLQFLGATLCETDAKGAHLLNRVGEEAELFKTVQTHLDEHRQIARPILEKMRSLGYFGNVGIDAFLYKKAGKTLLHPVVEINARKTMGWAALTLQRKYFPRELLALEYSRAATNLLPSSVTKKSGARASFSRSLNLFTFNSPDR